MWKYIIVRVGNRMEVPIIFPSRMVHSEMVECIKDYYTLEAFTVSGMTPSQGAVDGIRKSIIPVSAGDVSLTIESCGGSSETLKLSARPEDRVRMSSDAYTGGAIVTELGEDDGENI